MQYLSIRQVSEKWGISKHQVQTLCIEGCISGTIRVDSYLVIPADLEKYIKHIEL